MTKKNKISFGTTKINLFSVHFPTNLEERKLGAEELIDIIEKIDEDEIIIVGGDFNVGISKVGNHKYEFKKQDEYPEYKIIEKALTRIDNNEDTWFSSKGHGCIDTIFYSNNIKVRKIDTIENKTSDHSAVYAEFEV